MRPRVLPAAFAALALQAAPPSLSAILEHHQRSTTRDGLTRTVTYRELFIRTTDQVWLERLRPAHPSPPAPGEVHLHPRDLGAAGRHLHRDAEGRLHLSFADAEHRVLVAAEPRDYPEVGFDGSWPTAQHLVDPAQLRAMTRLPRPSAVRGARWYERREGARFLRILWSEVRQLPLEIESGTEDGSQSARIIVRPGPLPARLPWEHLQGYRRKEYTDLLD